MLVSFLHSYDVTPVKEGFCLFCFVLACNYFWLRSLNPGLFLSLFFLQLVEQYIPQFSSWGRLLTSTVIWFATLVMAQGEILHLG